MFPAAATLEMPVTDSIFLKALWMSEDENLE